MAEKPQYADIFKHIDSIVGGIRHPKYSELSSVYKEAVGRVALENMDPAEVIKDAEIKMNEIFNDN